MKRLTFVLFIGCFFFWPSVGEGKVAQAKIDQTVKKAVKYLLSQQGTKGEWKTKFSKEYAMGSTSLVLMALLKGGLKANHPAIRKGFAFLSRLSFESIYNASLYLMAIEAKYTPSDKVLKRLEKRYTRATIIRIIFQKKASPLDRRRAKMAAKWILRYREKRAWSYPGEREDNSNTQYAMLALSSAGRLGIKLPANVFIDAAYYWLEGQEKKGPKVKPFSVPGAEEPISKVRRKQWNRKFRRARTVEKKNFAYGKTSEKLTMYARGWGYVPGSSGEDGVVTGSMTTAGIAALVICKAQLEGSRDPRWKKIEQRVNRAIRDGCAWIGHNFRVDRNPPNLDEWQYYYLYGLERAATLAALHEFGLHDWYEKGARQIFQAQKQNGSINPISYEDDVVNTCFAILFLKRGTVPLRRMPKRIVTGSGGRR